MQVKKRLREIIHDKCIQKTIVYRILGISSSFLIGYVIFKTVEGSILATVLIEAVHTLMYFTMEKVWK